MKMVAHDGKGINGYEKALCAMKHPYSLPVIAVIIVTCRCGVFEFAGCWLWEISTKGCKLLLGVVDRAECMSISIFVHSYIGVPCAYHFDFQVRCI
ncbi:MAG: hypothetical protein ACI8Z1_003685 [Candidatus Azotimanducaceae bacterium]|jgi:hypothetical protein